MLERTACSGRKKNILVYFGRKEKDSIDGVQWGFEEEFASALFYCFSFHS